MSKIMQGASGGKYEKYKLDFSITEELDQAIEDLMHHINNTDGGSEDRYRAEIDFWLKDALMRNRINHDQYQELRDYYVLCEIYREYGRPQDLYKKEENNG